MTELDAYIEISVEKHGRGMGYSPFLTSQLSLIHEDAVADTICQHIEEGRRVMVIYSPMGEQDD